MTLHYRLDGPHGAPPLLLCNSLGTTLEMWDPQVSSADRAVPARPVRPARTRPLACASRPAIRSTDLGRDVLDLLDDLGIERVSFCGLSIGGMVGMWLASEAPERIDRLVLCSAAPSLPPREQWLERAATVRAEGVAAIADAVLDRWFTPLAPESLRESFRAMLVETPAEGYAGCCEALADVDLRDRLACDRRSDARRHRGRRSRLRRPRPASSLRPPSPAHATSQSPERRHISNAEQPSTFTQHVLAHLTEENP